MDLSYYFVLCSLVLWIQQAIGSGSHWFNKIEWEGGKKSLKFGNAFSLKLFFSRESGKYYHFLVYQGKYLCPACSMAAGQTGNSVRAGTLS